MPPSLRRWWSAETTSPPRFLGEPFPDKPVFFFWALAASLRAFGFSEPAARAPGLLFGLLGAVTTGWLAGAILGRRGGWLAGIFYATLSLPIGLMQMPVHDLALVPFTNGALLAFWRAARVSRAARVLAWSVAGRGVPGRRDPHQGPLGRRDRGPGARDGAACRTPPAPRHDRGRRARAGHRRRCGRAVVHRDGARAPGVSQLLLAPAPRARVHDGNAAPWEIGVALLPAGRARRRSAVDPVHALRAGAGCARVRRTQRPSAVSATPRGWAGACC